MKRQSRKASFFAEETALLFASLGCFAPFFLIVAAWLTHIATCLKHDQWGFLIAGALCFPVGIVHGVGVWLGLW